MSMSTSNSKFVSLHCLSNLFLNISVVGASITFSGKLVRKFAICKLKKYCLMLVLDNCKQKNKYKLKRNKHYKTMTAQITGP